MSKSWMVSWQAREHGSTQVSSAAVRSTPRITCRYNPSSLIRGHEWDKTIRPVGRPSQRIASATALAGGGCGCPCHDGWSNDAGAILIEQPTAYGISCSSVNQLPPADRGDRDPCLSSRRCSSSPCSGRIDSSINCCIPTTIFFSPSCTQNCWQTAQPGSCPEPCPPQYDQSARPGPRLRR